MKRKRGGLRPSVYQACGGASISLEDRMRSEVTHQVPGAFIRSETDYMSLLILRP